MRLTNKDFGVLRKLANLHNPVITVPEQVRRCVRSFIGTA